jgi:hypothetical protein
MDWWVWVLLVVALVVLGWATRPTRRPDDTMKRVDKYGGGPGGLPF